MYGRKVKLRFFFILLIITTLALSVFLLVKSLEENVIFFKSPTEIKTLSEIGKKKIRIGGMVKKDSITIISKEIRFIVTDFKIKNIDNAKVTIARNIKKNLNLTFRPYMD